MGEFQKCVQSMDEAEVLGTLRISLYDARGMCILSARLCAGDAGDGLLFSDGDSGICRRNPAV